ncbi:DUF4352 domain-containing protein [Enterococcus villorum]|uniref:DUF4352 domain-containing protein n=2 Tax=Enterococcus villorum TaxID=112904 RepID=A0A511J234_9ENTE|nr:DUF4352 domain-containing protein [Enterococcus villorum]EOH92547.1 hypothetical protein UAO_00433 [Enterococcus villorum ATCC 700913]EOW75650.1 hypothetical protein I591_02743 [Enterococcus villorum ATCC 700913]GEL92070.1 hypothetical protein EVI01_14070 [Enterococcus villorum]
MKKKLCYISLLATPFILAACSGSKSTTDSMNIQTSQKNTDDSKASETKFANYLEITPENLRMVADGSNDKKQIVMIDIKAVNTSAEKTGIGAYDFRLKVKDKEVTPYENAENFGLDIESKKEAKGTLSFQIDKGEKEFTLSYNPHGKELASWKFNVN